jgi:hypothetical protein
MNLFINYKRNVEPDQSFARFLDQALVQGGHEVFRDETGIASGAEWAQAIQRHLEDCEVVVSLVSNASLQSSWVLNEIDFARKRGKLIIPVLLEPLAESVEFQEYIPRFRRTQHYTYHGDDARAAQDILARLRQSVSLLDAQQFGTAAYRYDEEDDSENPAWRKFLEAHPHAFVNGAVHLGLEDAVRLALLRSVYYQRNLRATAPGGVEELPVDRRAFEAYRQGFYTQVALGEFGVSAFAAPDPAAEGKARGKKSGGYLGLLLRLEQARCRRKQLAALKTREEAGRARFEAGAADGSDLNEVLHAAATRELELLELQVEIEQDLEQFKTYVVGLPAEVPLVLEDPLQPQCQVIDPQVVALRDELMSCTRDLHTARWKQEQREGGGRWDPPAEVVERRRREPLLPPETWQRVAEILDQVEPRVVTHLDAAARELARATAGAAAGGQDGLEETRQELQTIREEFRKETSDLRYAVKSLRETPAGAAGDGGGSEGIDVDWDDFRGTIDRFRRGAVERRRMEEHVGDRLDGVPALVERLLLVGARLGLELLFPAAVEMSQEEAERLAAEHRPDREALTSDVALKRLLRQRLRRLLRELVRLREQLHIARRAWTNALVQAQMSYARYFVGRVTVDDPAQADVRLYEVLMNFLRLWFEFRADRMRLFRELGLMKIDDQGLWVDEAPPATGRAGEAVTVTAPEPPDQPGPAPSGAGTGSRGYVLPLLFLIVFASGFALGVGVCFSRWLGT